MKQVVIVGNGVAGITAARHIRKLSDCNIIVVSSETPYFFSRTALMYVYMGHLKFDQTKPYEDWFWKKNRINLLFDHAESIDTANRRIILRSNRSISYDQLILATGSISKLLDVPGIHLEGVQTLYGYHDLQSMERNTRNIGRAVVVGGGLIGVEMAEMLHSRKIETTVIVREAAFWNNVLPLEEARMISRHIMSHGVNLIHEQELREIQPDEHGKVRSIRTNEGVTIPCEFVGVTVGVQPNVAWLKDTPIKLNQGVLVNEYLETNVPGIYAIGDCVERQAAIPGRNSIEQVWYTARMMGETVARTVCGDRTRYQPGPWFNSAKFFDIEFQTYGSVPSVPSSDERDFYWEHQDSRKALHVVWNKQNERFVGINTFGIRLRHEDFDRWLREERTVDYVMRNLPKANFDPEFSKRHEAHIVNRFFEYYSTVNQDQCAS